MENKYLEEKIYRKKRHYRTAKQLQDVFTEGKEDPFRNKDEFTEEEFEEALKNKQDYQEVEVIDEETYIKENEEKSKAVEEYLQYEDDMENGEETDKIQDGAQIDDDEIGENESLLDEEIEMEATREDDSDQEEDDNLDEEDQESQAKAARA